MWQYNYLQHNVGHKYTSKEYKNGKWVYKYANDIISDSKKAFDKSGYHQMTNSISAARKNGKTLSSTLDTTKARLKSAAKESAGLKDEKAFYAAQKLKKQSENIKKEKKAKQVRQTIAKNKQSFVELVTKSKSKKLNNINVR